MNDVQLLQRYAAGDEGAFREIVHLYKDSVYAFIRRYLNQQDLVDDARDLIWARDPRWSLP